MNHFQAHSSYILWIIFLTILPKIAQAGEPELVSDFSPILIYAEIGTNVLVSSGSLSLEGKLFANKKRNLHMYGRIGGGAAGLWHDSAGPGGKASLHILTGARNHHFEGYAGLFVGDAQWVGGPGVFSFPIVGFGYRFQPPEEGFVFRGFLGSNGLGIGVGYAFGQQ